MATTINNIGPMLKESERATVEGGLLSRLWFLKIREINEAIRALQTKIGEYDSAMVGSIAMTYDETIPTDWTELDGGTITDGAIDYPLVAARYPWMVSGNNLVKPNMRGRTVRGWDHAAGVDPNAASRTARVGGQTGDYPGTYQADEYKQHSHSGTFATTAGANGSQGAGGAFHRIVNSGSVGNSGGSETRMINIAVTFIMRLK